MSSSLHDHAELSPPHVEEIAEDVFAYVQPDGGWFINNTGFIRGGRDVGVVAIDTCATERRTRALIETIQEVAGSPPRILVNTHHHADHTNGNYLLPDSVVIGHQKSREEMLKTGLLQLDGVFEPVEWGGLGLRPPFVTFPHELTLHTGELRVELLRPASAAHTTNDVLAWLPQERILFSGDLVWNGCTPFVLMGSVAGAIEALDYIVELDPAVVVPGHGPPCDLTALETCGRYLRWVQTSSATARSSGMAPLQAARELDLGEFSELQDPERLAGNLHRAYAELDGVRPGDDIDYLAAFADMITLNGGKPLRCRA